MVRKAAAALVAFLALAALIGFLASGGGSGGADMAGRAARPEAQATAVPGAVAGTTGAFEAVGDAALDVSGAAIGELPGLPPLGQAVVKTAELTLEVRKGTFADRFDEASLVASAYGGYVESSRISGAEARSGALTIRVPAERFDEAMSDLRALGTVTEQSITGQVVTQEFIDLEARLRTWQAQEAVLLRLMDQAGSVDVTLRIQRELQDVQFRIEQIKGQLRVLEDRTSLATIHVSMLEAGAVLPLEVQTRDTRPSLAEAWGRAVDGFLSVAYATVVGLGYLVPITVLALVAWFGYRGVARRVRPRAPAV